VVQDILKCGHNLGLLVIIVGGFGSIVLSFNVRRSMWSARGPAAANSYSCGWLVIGARK